MSRPARVRRAAGLRQLLAGLPTACWVCALVGFLNAAAWSVAVPPFMGPDEASHFAFVQTLIESHKTPTSSEEFSAEEEAALAFLHVAETILDPTRGLIRGEAEGQLLRRELGSQPSRVGKGGAGVAASEPPLYYALEGVPYLLGSGSTLMVQLELMRLLSALMAGATVFFVFLFLREALPAVPWSWTVGGLCAALAPLLGSVSGTVNPDALLFTVSAAVFFALARAFRRGLTVKLAIAIGTLVAIGFASKLNFIGLVPGAMLGLVILAVRRGRTSGYAVAGRALALGAGIALSPVLAYVAVKELGRGTGPISGYASVITTKPGGLPAALSYLWQLYFPRLPGMVNDFPGISSTLQIWFKGLIGRYNWLETVFPSWVYVFALIPAGLIGALAVRGSILYRAALRSRLLELIVYMTMVGGLMTLVAVGSYPLFPLSYAAESEPRYMLPLLALGCGVLVLAARGAGRLWGPAVGALIVLLIMAHDIFSQLLELSRFYV